jgi:Flp pilus assembly protein TadG
MAIILPFILLCLLGVTEVTTAMTHYVTVINASRDGARYGSKSFTDGEIRSVTLNDLASLPGITPASNITIDRAPAVAGDTTVSVTACYDHHLLIHVTLVAPDVIRMCEKTTMRVIPTPGP